jgi:hypothetical protein
MEEVKQGCIHSSRNLDLPGSHVVCAANPVELVRILSFSGQGVGKSKCEPLNQPLSRCCQMGVWEIVGISST